MPLSFKYPITKADGSEFNSAKELLGQLSGESAGFYLLSAHGFWHGGLHISDDTSGYVVDKQPVRSMATGEVVAYRLNDDYRTSTWGEAASAQTLQYSTSFCLVRHTYESPHKSPSTDAAPPKPAAQGQGSQNTLVFYSLYMHLQPYVGYAQRVVIQGGSALAYTQFPGSGDHTSSSMTTQDLSSAPNSAFNATLYGLRPVTAPITVLTGTELSVLNEAEWVSGNLMTKMLYVTVNAVPTLSGASPVDTGSASGAAVVTVGQHYWVAINGDRLNTVNGAAVRKRPTYWKCSRKTTATLIQSISALRDPSGDKAGVTIDTMPSGTKIEIEREQLLKQDGKKKPFAQVKVLSFGDGYTGSTVLGELVWVSSAENDLAREPVIPDSFNDIVICDPPPPIEAGATIGYLGMYETPGPSDESKVSRQQVHVEIFTGDPKFDDFFANAAGLTEGKKYKIAGTDGAPAKASTSGGANTFTRGTDPLLLPVAVDTTASLAKQDSLHKNWFPVQGIGESGVLNGWVPESELKEVMQYEWEKLGFRKVEEASASADGYMDPDKMPAFFKSIYKLIHASTAGEVTPEELIAANHNPVVRNALAHVVAKHPSEWQGKADSAKWNVIKENEALLKNDPKRLKHELERIDALSWWDEARRVKDFPASSNVWHFNPPTFVETLLATECVCNKCGANLTPTPQILKQIYTQMSAIQAADFSVVLEKLLAKYAINSCNRFAHFFGQSRIETQGFLGLQENLRYTHYGVLPESYKRRISNYYRKRDPGLTDAQIGQMTKDNLISTNTKNHDSDLGLVLFEDSRSPGVDFRGRGLIHLTGFDNYSSYMNYSSIDVVHAPNKLKDDPFVTSDSALWYWNIFRTIGPVADENNVSAVTRKVNGGHTGYSERKIATKDIFANAIRPGVVCKEAWVRTLTKENGWT